MCGIAAYIGEISPNTKLLVKHIALRQDSRGGDGAGFGYFKDGIPIIVKGSPKNEPVTKLLEKRQNDSRVDAYPVSTLEELLCLYKDIPTEFDGSIIFHSRKTTSGITSNAFSHPYVFSKADGKGYIIGVHNGTIYNVKDIAAKVEYPIKSAYTDSQVLLYALAQGMMPSIYGDIRGSMALVWMESDKPGELFVLVRSSDYAKYTSRPLHFYRDGNTCYISSEADPLYNIRSLNTTPIVIDDVSTRELDPVYAFPTDVIYRLTATSNKVIKTLHKTPIFETPQQNAPLNKKVNNSQPLVDKTLPCKYGHIVYSNGLYRDYMNNYVYTTYKYDNNTNEVEVLGGHLYGQNGEQIYSIYGKLHTKHLDFKKNPYYTSYTGEVYELYFIKGVMIKSKQDFIRIIQSCRNPSNLIAKDLYRYSVYPIPMYIPKTANLNTCSLYFNNTGENTFHPLFTYKTYRLHQNLLTAVYTDTKDHYRKIYNQQFSYENPSIFVEPEENKQFAEV